MGFLPAYSIADRVLADKSLSPDSAPHARNDFMRSLHALWREDPAETALLVALIAGLAWAPFWLGGDRPIAWGVNGVLFPMLAVAYEVSLLVRGRRHAVGLKRLALPAALFVLAVIWAAVQMSTLAPPSIAHPIWAMASDVLDRPLDGSISVNRGATALALMRLLTDAAAFWLALQLSRHSARAILLLQSIATIVAAYSLYGLLLTAVYRGGIPFFDVPDVGGLVRSTFVNRNNFATYAGLGVVTTLALILRLYRHEVPDHAGLSSYRLTKLIEATGRRGWLMLGTGLISLAALLGSISRGGILATALGVFAVLVFSYTRKRKRRGEQLEAIVFVSLAVVAAFFFFGDLIIGRIATTGLEDTNRMAVYLIVIRSILDSPILGFGYGTFADVFPMYRDASISAIGVWDMAHNTYLEVFQGLGLIVGAALIGSLALLAGQCLRGALKRRRDATPSIVGAACALLVGAHALVDFSLQIEAVTLTFMALLGAGVAESESSRVALSD